VSELKRNANLMKLGNFIDVFLPRHVSGTYTHHQEHYMLSCSIRFSTPRVWMGGGLESRCVGRFYGEDGAVHLPHRTQDLRRGSQDHHLSKTSVQKTICCNSTSNAPDDGRMYPKHVELRINQSNYVVASSWHFTLFHEEDARSNNPRVPGVTGDNNETPDQDSRSKGQRLK